ncbi:carbon-nitrogen hydrolase family protein [Actinocorallia sp. A-T 12471]|uniref:carbon-nitrogen hydrolase family protein n=1 Tax=Actinocorallia sp. A-T 12471 TaxID=3089813 RepID=UPI0029CB2E3B|nr:carbon-nitrogen hydrolase family protein [Actinocorallia sp. A-T 12471]MDX6739622.1 carbon-nitrogen hydrolase family protein [Actinocorallia sp. A-T 12471]
MPDTYTLAVAQPRTAPPERREDNAARAVELVAEAAARGADLVLFPEHSPGPFTEAESYDAAPAMAEAARAHGVNVCWSRMERCPDGLFRLVVHVTDRTGAPAFRYERSHPATVPPKDTGGWVAPGPVLGSFTLDGVPMGIVVCSELWIPEPARVLALRGAEILLSPAGGGFTSLAPNWEMIARVRAVENQCYLALTNNLWDVESGSAMVTGPEHPLAVAGRAELAVAPLDLARLRWLRAQDDQLGAVKPFDAIPGLLRARRPELYAELSEPRDGLFDYHTPPQEISEQR